MENFYSKDRIRRGQKQKSVEPNRAEVESRSTNDNNESLSDFLGGVTMDYKFAFSHQTVINLDTVRNSIDRVLDLIGIATNEVLTIYADHVENRRAYAVIALQEDCAEEVFLAIENEFASGGVAVEAVPYGSLARATVIG